MGRRSGRDVFELIQTRPDLTTATPSPFQAYYMFTITDPQLAAGGTTPCDNVAQGACQSLIDGWGYDATDDALWYSPDGSERDYEFKIPGPPPDEIVGQTAPLLGFFDTNDQPDAMADECGGSNENSGIGVGRNDLYLTNPECPKLSGASAFYFQYKRKAPYQTEGDCPTPPTGATDATYCPGDELKHFPYNGHRAEDLECDSDTYNVDVMWVRDENDSQLRAYELPTGSCLTGGGVGVFSKDRMTGGGELPGVDTTNPASTASLKVHHGFVLHCQANAPEGDNLEVNWGRNSFHMTALSSSGCFHDPPLLDPTAPFNTIQGEAIGILRGPNFGTNGKCYPSQPGSPGCARVHWTFTDDGGADHGHIEIYKTVSNQDTTPILIADGFLGTGPMIGGGNYTAHQG